MNSTSARPPGNLVAYGGISRVCGRLAITVVLSVLLAPTALRGQMWDGGGGDDNWSTAANWNPDVRPANDGSADIHFAGTNRLAPNLDTDWNINSLSFDPMASAFTLGTSNSSTLSIQAGGISNNSAQLQTVNVPIKIGADQTWTANTGSMSFGGPVNTAGHTVTISDSSDVTIAGAVGGAGGLKKFGTGTVTLTGANSVLAAFVEAGVLKVASGGQFNTSAAVYIAEVNNSTATVTVEGNSSKWTTAYLDVGEISAGILNIKSGGQVSSTSAFLGTRSSASGSAVVDGVDSKWTTGTLTVGHSGSGNMEITNGGQVSITTNTFLGGDSGSTGYATIAGNGSKLTVGGQLAVGDSGAAIIDVNTGGQVDAHTIVFIGGRPGSTGMVTVKGSNSKLVVGTTVQVGAFGSGTLQVLNGAEFSGSAGIGIRETGVGEMIVDGSGTKWNGDDFSVGLLDGSKGKLTISGGASAVLTTGAEIEQPNSLVVIDRSTLKIGGLEGAGGTIQLTDPQSGAALTIGGNGLHQPWAGTIVDGPSGPGSVYLVGPGGFNALGHNTYSGRTTISGTEFEADDGIGLPAASNLAFTAGGVLVPFFDSSGTFIRSLGAASGQVQWTGDGGFSAAGKKFTVNLGGHSDQVAWGVGGFVPTGSALVFGSTAASSETEFQNPIDLGSLNRTVEVRPGYRNDFATLSGKLSGSGGLIKTGNGKLVLSGNNTYTGPTEVKAGQLVVTGSIVSPMDVGAGATVKGSGNFGPVNVLSGGTFSPGNSPGTANTGAVTWNSGGNYLFEVHDATGIAGIDWDLWNINGALTINAGTTPGNLFNVNIASLLADNSSGAADHFSAGNAYHWRIATASSGITGFDPGKFLLDTSGFKNPLAGGHFALMQTGNDLFLNFAPVPEPSTILLAGIAGAGLALFGRVRLRKS